MQDEVLLDAYELRPSVRMWRRHPGFARGVLAMRALSDHEFVLITQSTGVYVDDEGTRALIAGDLYLCRPGHPHEWRWGRYGTEHVFFHFDFDPLHRRPTGPVRLAGARPFPKVLRLGLHAPAAVQMMRIADTIKPEQPWSHLIWQGAALEFLALLAAGPLRAVHAEGAGGGAVNELRVQRALDYLEAHLADAGMTVAHLAEQARLSEPHFRRLCREVTGRSPNDLITRRRLRRARQLLLDPRYQIAEVARLCGVADPRYFARLFRKIEGLSPQQYRQSVLSARR